MLDLMTFILKAKSPTIHRKARLTQSGSLLEIDKIPKIVEFSHWVIEAIESEPYTTLSHIFIYSNIVRLCCLYSAIFMILLRLLSIVWVNICIHTFLIQNWIYEKVYFYLGINLNGSYAVYRKKFHSRLFDVALPKSRKVGFFYSGRVKVDKRDLICGWW